MEEGEKGKVYEGTVRSYRAVSDYGFIMTAEINKDVYFRSDSLPADFKAGVGFCPLEGLEVTYKLHKLPDGKPQAKQIQVLGTVGQPMMGTVKSFDVVRGFGFIMSSAFEGDIFFGKGQVPPHINPNAMSGVHARFELVHDERTGKYKAVGCIFKNDLAPGPPLHRHGDMPFFGGPPIDPMGLPFPHAGFPPGHGPAAWLPPPPGPSSVPAAPGRAPPPGSGGAEMFGEVKSCNAKTKYGFLTSPDFHSDIYFRASDVLGNIELLPGQPVSFILRFREDGHAIAKNIALMSSFDFGFGAAEPYDPDNVAPQEKRKRQKAKKGKSKRARVETQQELDGTGYNGLSPSSGAYVAQANDPQARPRPSSSYDRLADVQDKDYFGVISTEFERVRGYGYLICDETGEEIPFSESNSAFQEGEEVAFRIEYGPERELLAVGLRLLDP